LEDDRNIEANARPTWISSAAKVSVESTPSQFRITPGNATGEKKGSSEQHLSRILPFSSLDGTSKAPLHEKEIRS
jgi:hypothetical protein